MKYIKKLLTLFSICLFSLVANGQTIKADKIDVIAESKGEYCESNNSMVDLLLTLLNTNSEEKLFVISHAGTSEGLSIVKQRLDHTKLVLLKIKNFNDKRVIFASGDKVKGNGKLEFYIGSQLYLVLNMKKNKQVCYLTYGYCGPKNEFCK